MSESCARFGAALRVARRRQHLTQEQLAERSGLTYKAVGQIERGEGNPRLTTMERLSRALDVDLQSLVPTTRPKTEHAAVDERISEALHAVKEAVRSMELVVGAGPATTDKRRRRLVR